MAKRSEALSVIMNHLEMQGRTDEIAMYILDALEELGMFPPNIGDEESYELHLEWEKEDE